MRFNLCNGLCGFTVVLWGVAFAAQAEDAAGIDPTKRPIAEQRLEIMTARIHDIVVSSNDPLVPDHFEPKPLFRYDDETRGYVDGTLWRLGAKGRPLAIITAELHPDYLGGGKRVVYDMLSLTDTRFTARSDSLTQWTPSQSAFEMKPLPDAPRPSDNAARRLTQIKEQSRRFTGTQEVTELETMNVNLRLLPREIERYAPGSNELADGAIFLLVNGRNPALVLLVETDGTDWQYGVGRLSLPSNLELQLDGTRVWSQPRNLGSGQTLPYYATNSTAEFP